MQITGVVDYRICRFLKNFPRSVSPSNSSFLPGLSPKQNLLFLGLICCLSAVPGIDWILSCHRITGKLSLWTVKFGSYHIRVWSLISRKSRKSQTHYFWCRCYLYIDWNINGFCMLNACCPTNDSMRFLGTNIGQDVHIVVESWYFHVPQISNQWRLYGSYLAATSDSQCCGMLMWVVYF